ncbi:MAG: vWA domain-containing protein [Saprospiraceae bacterium]
MESTPNITEQNGRILFDFSGVTFKENKTVYQIDDILTERKNSDGCWIVDNENFLSYSFSKSLDIVLVLDVSSSLGQNISTIKDNAVDMITNILTNNPEAKIAVLKFSRGSVNTNFSSSISMLTQFILQDAIFNSPDIGNYVLEGRNETGLYEAINSAIQLIDASSARGKGILTFTDGVSNFSFDPQFSTPDNVISSLTNSDISSYTIGYEGNQNSVEQSILEQIAVNGDFSFPRNLNDLDQVFQVFSNSVAAVYDLTYDTNNAKFDGEIEYRFLFNTTKISD